MTIYDSMLKAGIVSHYELQHVTPGLEAKMAKTDYRHKHKD